MIIRAILDNAEQSILERGWSRANHQQSVLTHLYAAAGARFGHVREIDVPGLHDALSMLRDHLKVQHISLWENDPERTLDDVLAAIRAVKEKLNQ